MSRKVTACSQVLLTLLNSCKNRRYRLLVSYRWYTHMLPWHLHSRLYKIQLWKGCIVTRSSRIHGSSIPFLDVSFSCTGTFLSALSRAGQDGLVFEFTLWGISICIAWRVVYRILRKLSVLSADVTWSFSRCTVSNSRGVLLTPHATASTYKAMFLDDVDGFLCSIDGLHLWIFLS